MFFPATIRGRAIKRDLCALLQAQGCEIHRATAPFTVTMKKKAPARSAARDQPPRSVAVAHRSSQVAGRTEARTFPAGSYLVRMDQPYSRIADALLDYQYWSPRDPQQNVYDDTGWTFGELGNIQVVRVTDVKVLDAPMDRVNGEVRSPGGVTGNGSIYLVNHNADNNLITLRYRLRRASFDAAEEPFEAAGKKFNRGSFIIRNASADEVNKATSELGIQAFAVADRADRENSSGQSRARRDHAHLAKHAGRRLVAAGVRSDGSSVRLHQHAGRREGQRPEQEV